MKNYTVTYLSVAFTTRTVHNVAASSPEAAKAIVEGRDDCDMVKVVLEGETAVYRNPSTATRLLSEQGE